MQKLFENPLYAGFMLFIKRDWHTVLRDMLNERVAQSYTDAIKNNYDVLTDDMARYHDPTNNYKCISPDGHMEGVYSKKDKQLNTEIQFKGTFNFYSCKISPLGHFLADMIPYYRWGN